MERTHPTCHIVLASTACEHVCCALCHAMRKLGNSKHTAVGDCVCPESMPVCEGDYGMIQG